MTDEKTQKTFPLEKILTCSADAYITHSPNSHTGTEYDFVGVHVDVNTISVDAVIEAFVEKVPQNAEVVVDYRFFVGASPGASPGHSIQKASGTALIPRK